MKNISGRIFKRAEKVEICRQNAVITGRAVILERKSDIDGKLTEGGKQSFPLYDFYGDISIAPDDVVVSNGRRYLTVKTNEVSAFSTLFCYRAVLERMM